MKLIASPKVSVIIPTYNSAKYIIETINSIINQTVAPFEIIVVDDGSTDETGLLLESRFGDKIHYIYQENRGPAPARNTGIRNARGNLIAFIDADDLWLPQKLEKQIIYLKDNPEIALVYTNLYLFSDEGIKSPVKFRPHYGDGFLHLLRRNYIATSTVLVKKECFDKLGLFDERPEIEAAEDYEMWLRISRYFKIGCIKEKLAKHRVSSLSHSRVLERQIRAGTLVKRQYLDTLPNNKQMQKLKALCWREFHQNSAYAYFYQKKFLKARSHFKMSFKYGGYRSKHLIYFLSTFLPPNIFVILNGRMKIIKKIAEYF